MNPNKCPCECHEDFDHGSALVVAEYAKRIRDLEAEIQRLKEKSDKFQKMYEATVVREREAYAEINKLKDDVRRYRNG